MHKQGNLDYTCFKGHGVDELNVSCRESEMSPGKLAVCAVEFILKETLSSDMRHKAAVLLHICDHAFKLHPIQCSCPEPSSLNGLLIDHFQLVKSLSSSSGPLAFLPQKECGNNCCRDDIDCFMNSEAGSIDQRALNDRRSTAAFS